MRDYEDRLAIATPEGVRVELVLAGLGSRFTAALIDLALKLVLLAAILLLTTILGSVGTAIATISSLVVYLGYDIAFEVLANGQTPGKGRTRMRVLRADGRSIDLLSSAIRNVVRLVDGLLFAYLPGMVCILVTKRNQRLGDLAGGTIVVNETAVEPLGRVGAFLPPAEPASGPPLDVTAVTPEDLGTLRAFLTRRPQLAPGPRTDLARRLSAAVRPRVGGATEHLGDEELIELVVAAKDA